MQKIEHIGIAVKNLEESNALFAKLLNTVHYKTEEVPSEGVITSFFKVGEVKIELAIHDTPKEGADQKIIAFLHPKSTQRVLTEICSDSHATK